MQGVVLHIVKHLKIGIHEIAAVAIITFATLLRVLVTALGWPRTNSDEDTIGIMGLHIAYHGDHPIFFLFLGIAFLLGTINIFSEIPSAQTANQQQDALVNDLLRIGATHIYTDYWTCDRIAFVSNEKIICGIIDDNLQPSHNRYYPYYLEVKADPHAAYVYPLDLPQWLIIAQKAHLSGGNYQQFVFDGYVVYQPRAT